MAKGSEVVQIWLVDSTGHGEITSKLSEPASTTSKTRLSASAMLWYHRYQRAPAAITSSLGVRYHFMPKVRDGTWELFRPRPPALLVTARTARGKSRSQINGPSPGNFHRTQNHVPGSTLNRGTVYRDLRRCCVRCSAPCGAAIILTHSVRNLIRGRCRRHQISDATSTISTVKLRCFATNCAGT